MPRLNLLQADQSYTFGSYFDFPYKPDEILAEFGDSLHTTRLPLPHSERSSERLSLLQQHLEEILPFVSLSSETARRELLVAPILTEVVRLCHCQLRIEYSLMVNRWLKGELDYLLRSKHHLTVIEAKREDLTRGFTQLAVELIALAQAEEQSLLYGAVTTGEIWRFGQLDATAQTITQDLTLYNIPDHLADLMAILIGVLEDE